MSLDSTFDHLFNVLEGHNIDISRADLRQKLGDQDCEEFATWIKEYLDQQTLLSADEATLYERLEKSGVASQLQGAYDVRLFTPLQDDEIQHAVLALEAATSAIEAQNANLKEQCDALTVFQKSRLHREAEIEGAVTHNYRTQQKALHSLQLALEEASEDLQETLGEMKNSAQQVEASTLRLIEDTANRDDRELSKMEKLVSELGDNGGESILVQKDKLCAALAGFSIDSIKCRLTRIYLATLWSRQNSSDTPTVRDNDVECELMSELDSLYDEILPVTEMSIEHNYGLPLQTAAAEHLKLFKAQSTAILDHVQNSTMDMLKAAELLRSELLEHDSQVLALHYISKQIYNTIEHGLNRFLGPEASDAVHNGTSKGTASRFGTDGGAVSSYGSGTLHTRKTFPSTRQLFGILGIIPDNDLPHDISTERLNITAINQERKSNIRSNEAERLVLSTVAASTKEFSDAQQLLLNALLSETVFAGVKMSNPELQSRKERLCKTIEIIGAGLASLDIGMLRKFGKTRKEFVGRWKAV